MRGRLRWGTQYLGVLLGVSLTLALAPVVQAAALSVQYRTASHIYVNGGRSAGLAVGDHLLVKAGKETVAELEVEYVAEQSASCKIVSEAKPVVAGAVVVPKPKPAPAAAAGGGAAATPGAAKTAEGGAAAVESKVATVPSPASSAPPVRNNRWGRARGGLSLGYTKVVDNTSSQFDFQQRTARFDLTVTEIDGRPLSFTARAQGRQDLRANMIGPSTPANEHEYRFYELALRYEPPSQRLRLEAGRIGVSRFVGIGYIDGALAEARVKGGLFAGLFGGLRAEPWGLETDGRGPKYGAFVHLAPQQARSFESQIALVREMAASEVSRDYFSVETRYRPARRLNLVELAEIDWNRGWRRDASGGRTFQISRLVLSANWRLSSLATAYLSYDNSRNYRSHVNQTVAEAFFDDLARQGLRASLSVGKGLGLNGSVGLGVRARSGNKSTYSFQGALRHGGLFGGKYNTGIDGSFYTGDFGHGGMGSLRFGRRFQAGHSVDLSYTYSLYHLGDTGGVLTSANRVTQWVRLSGRFELPRRLYIVPDVEYDAGDDLKGPRFFVEMGYRF